MESGRVKEFYETFDFASMITDPPEQIQGFLDGEIAWLRDNIRPGKDLLEVGCGYGRLLELLSERAGRAAGIDFSRPLLDGARALLGEDAELHLMHAERMEFPDETFDYVLCLDASYGNMPGLEEAVLGEMVRVCKAGGHVVVSVFSEHAKEAQIENYLRIGLEGVRDDGTAIHTDEGFYSRRFTESDLRRLFGRNGLECEITSICPINYIAVAEKR